MNELQIFENKELQSNPIIQTAFSTMKEDELRNFKLSVLDIMGNENLKGVSVQELTLTALKAVSIGLPISKEEGLAYILPFTDKGTKKAVLVISVKALKARALETGLVSALNSGKVYEGELCNINRMKGTFEIDESKRKSETVIGYFAYIQLVNGFEKALFMSIQDLNAHALKYSKECEWNKDEYGKSVRGNKKMPTFWVNEFDKMADKTVVKQLLKAVPLLNSKKAKKLAEMLDEETEFYENDGSIQADDDGVIITEEQKKQAQKEAVKPTTKATNIEDDDPFADEETANAELEKALNTVLPTSKIPEYAGKTIKEILLLNPDFEKHILKRAETDNTDDFTTACKVYKSFKG